MSANEGVGAHALNSPIADWMSEEAPKPGLMHLETGRKGGYATNKPFCGALSQRVTRAEDCVDCETCMKEVAGRQERADLRMLNRIATAPVHVRDLDPSTRDRLLMRGEIIRQKSEDGRIGAYVFITAKGLERRVAKNAKKGR